MVVSPATIKDKEHSTLELKFKCNDRDRTIIAHQYESHPIRVSRAFRLDDRDKNRAYVYLRNNSPGLFGEDVLNLTFDLAKDTRLYLTEQSATKVHPMKPGIEATVNYQWKIGQNSMVEFVPEPIILYQDSRLSQTTKIYLHKTASLFWSDRILPGRLARGEIYQFDYYAHNWEIYSEQKELICRQRMYLKGKANPYVSHKLFASLPIMGNAIAIMPNIESSLLKSTLDNLENNDSDNLIVATSVLPQEKGVLIQALASKSQSIARYWQSIIGVLRKLNKQSPLPRIPK